MLLAKQVSNQKGVALLLTVFVIAILSILIVDFTEDVESFQRTNREYTEGVQARLVLKSAISLAKLLLEAPKPEATQEEDWLYEAWNNIASLPEIPLEGITGNLRLMITDEDGKIDLNSIQPYSYFPTATPSIGQSQNPKPADLTTFWKNSLKELFTNIGMERQQFKKEEFRTLGNAAYSPSDQVAIIADWIDKDKDSFQSSLFDGKGFESTADKGWFFNRPFKNISDLANVPGITLNELQYLSKFLKVTIGSPGTNSAININTAPVEVLQAIGFPENQIAEIARQRLSYPYTTQSASVLTAGNEQLKGKVKFKSSEFSAIARIEMPTKVFWVKSQISMQQGVGNRKATIRSYEFY